jgi:hypothetical protein
MFKKRNNQVENDEQVQFVSKRSSSGRVNKGSDSKTPDAGGPRVSPKNSYWKPNASINNIEYEKKKEVDQEISDQNKRRKRRQRARTTLKLSLVAASLLVLFLLLGLSARRVNLSVDGVGKNEYYTELDSYVSKSVGGGILGYVHPSFFRYENIEKNVVEDREDVGELELKFNIWKLRTEARILPNIPLVKWVGNEGNVSYVNQKGLIFNPPEELIELSKPIELGGSGIGVEEDSNVLARSDKLNWVVSVIPILKEQGIVPQKVNIDAGSFRAVEVLLNGYETRIIFSVDEDPAQSGIAAARSVKFLQKGGVEVLKSVGYIDVRTPERVVYR